MAKVPLSVVSKVVRVERVIAGRERSGISLKHNQQFRAFGSDWVTGDPDYPLVEGYTVAPEANRSMRDSDTGDLLPITILAGHTLTVVAIAYSVNQDVLIYAYIDALTVGVCVNLGALGGGQMSYENKLREVSTIWYDPTATYPHTLDIRTYNVGGADLYGGVALLCIEEIVGTEPFPTTKDCVCPHCEHKQTEPISATRITCKGCDKQYMVTNFAALRQLGG
ncbi:hypothetical protein ES705_10352 [subsurface metagenome]